MLTLLLLLLFLIPFFVTLFSVTVAFKRYCKAVNGSIPWHSYGVSLAIWDHTVLPATRHK